VTAGVVAIFLFGAVFRVLAFSVGVLRKDFFEHVLLLLPPSSSSSCRREGAFLLRQGLSPLSHGGLCSSQPPLLLAALGGLHEWTATALLIGCDLACAWLLLRLSAQRGTGLLACGVFLCSPWAVLASASGSSATLPGLCALASIHLAAHGRALLAAVPLALGTLVAPDLAWMCFPAAGLVAASSQTNSGALAAVQRFLSATALVASLAMSCLAIPPLGGLRNLVRGTFGAWLGGGPVHGIPNVGLWWYLMAEVYVPLRPPFVAALHLLPRLCIPALALRMHRSLMAAPPPQRRRLSRSLSLRVRCSAIALATVVFTRQAPSPPEIVLALALLGSQLDDRTIGATRHLPHAAVAIGIGAFTAHPLLGAWVESRELNANFFYAASLLLSGGALLAVYDVAAATARDLHAGDLTPVAAL
jgi:hypothetical protein